MYTVHAGRSKMWIASCPTLAQARESAHAISLVAKKGASIYHQGKMVETIYANKQRASKRAVRNNPLPYEVYLGNWRLPNSRHATLEQARYAVSVAMPGYTGDLWIYWENVVLERWSHGVCYLGQDRGVR